MRVSAPSRDVVILGLGSNRGDSVTLLARALERLSVQGEVAGVSSLYRTQPVGDPDQPDFLNAVALVRTALSPVEMLSFARSMEEEAGRKRTTPNGPRTLDVDILFHGNHIIATADLEIPHPRWRDRAFVLVPLSEIAPGWRDPVSGRTVSEVWATWRGRERLPERVGGPETLTGANP